MDYLSRLEFGESDDEVRDEFPDAQLFKITTEEATDESVLVEDKWMMNMHQFVSTGRPLEEMNQDERKLLEV